MQLADFHYELPDELIAQKPLERRSDSRLLCLDPRLGGLRDDQFAILPELLNPGDLLVFNNTRVIPARLFGRKASGGRVEVLVERIIGPTRMLCHVRAGKSPKPGGRLIVGSVEIEVRGRADDLFELELLGATVKALLDAEGHMPLPPYIRREDELADKERYQTVYGDRPGAVAAPTAGLHFDEAMLIRLHERGVDMGFVTLHVGAGTFQPVRTCNLEEHVMHSEYLEVNESLCEQVEATRGRGGRVVAVGTTSVRSLETAAMAGRLAPYRGETRLFIRPGYRFKVVDALLTNFHLPESTLLMLVAAFAGYEPVMQAYRHAVAERYRFFSYGDAMWLTRVFGASASKA